jgi:hypothetical protein
MTEQEDGGPGKKPVSVRKIQANRLNASKSTGPKSPRGKGYSRRNALKHGLFAVDLYMAALTKWEDPNEYQDLLDRLLRDYQAVGAPEELEVQRITACWWKLSRVWRYENAQIAGKLCTRHAELNKLKTLSSEHQAHLVLLKNAETEVETTGKISDELDARMFADVGFRKLWESVEAEFNELLAGQIGLPPEMTKEITGADPEGRKQCLHATIRLTALALERRGLLFGETIKLCNDREALSPGDTLDRALRADGAADRGLNRSIDRLERLQRSRKGESVLPLVKVQLT